MPRSVHPAVLLFLSLLACAGSDKAESDEDDGSGADCPGFDCEVDYPEDCPAYADDLDAWEDDCDWDERCEATCTAIYGEDACDIQKAGSTTQEMVDTCMGYCVDASATPGELGDYDPFVNAGISGSPTLDSRAHVVEWRTCVEQLSCGALESGYCAPIW